MQVITQNSAYFIMNFREELINRLSLINLVSTAQFQAALNRRNLQLAIIVGFLIPSGISLEVEIKIKMNKILNMMVLIKREHNLKFQQTPSLIGYLRHQLRGSQETSVENQQAQWFHLIILKIK